MSDNYHFETKGVKPVFPDEDCFEPGDGAPSEEIEKQHAVGDLVKHFIETTGAPAVQDVAQLNGPNFIRRPFFFWRIVWALFWLFCWFGFCYQMTFLVIRYQADPVYINLEILSEESLTFPSVTICNVNPVKKSFLLATKDFQTLGTLDETFAYTFEKEAIEDAGGESSSVSCSSETVTMFECADRSLCIPESWQCDGTDDCEDKSDEVNCADVDYEPNQGTCAFGFYECQDDSKLCIRFEQKCDGVIDCDSGWDESVDEGCPVTSEDAGCPGLQSDPIEFSSSNGSYVITSPKADSGEEYRPNAHCYWLIRVPEGESLYIQVDDFNLEPSSHCESDYLRILEYRSDGSSFFDMTFCGIDVEREIELFSNQVFLEFRSDSAINKEGFSISITAKAHRNWDLRVEGNLPNVGLLLTYISEEKAWKSFCLSSFSNSDQNAAVACEQLDFKSPPTGAGVTAASTTSSDYDVSKYSPYQFGINCNEASGSLQSCVNETPVTCESDSYVFLSCEGSFDNGQLRLVPTISEDLEFIGRVEVYYEGSWGTICQDSFGEADADVVCKQLGYDNGAMYSFTAGTTDPGAGPVWLDNVDCKGTESRVNECGNNGWGISNCRHKEDVGVACRVGLEGHFCVPTSTSTPADSISTSPTISCPQDQVIYPVYAQMGFLATDVCVAESVSNCKQDDIGGKIWGQCNGLNSCEIDVSDFKNPCPHKRQSTGRELDVVYNCTEAYCDYPFVRNGDGCFYIGIYSVEYPLDLQEAQRLCKEHTGTALISDHTNYELFNGWADNLEVLSFLNESGHDTCQILGAGEPVQCDGRTVTSFICQKRTYSVIGIDFQARTKSNDLSAWTEWICTSPCDGEESLQMRTRECRSDVCQDATVEVTTCNNLHQPPCNPQNDEHFVLFNLKSYMGGEVTDQLFLDNSSLGYRYLLYHVSTLIEIIVQRYNDEFGFVSDGYKNVTIEAGLEVSFVVVSGLNLTISDVNFQSLTDLTMGLIGPISVNETTDFRTQLRNGAVITNLPNYEGNVAKRRRSTDENEAVWDWFGEQPITSEDDDVNTTTNALHLKQFDGLEPFDWKNAIEASEEDDYSDFRAMALFEGNVIDNYGHQLIDTIAQCTFDGVTCSLEDFDVIKNPFYGNCFVFNQKNNNRSEVRATSKTGMQWGLKITLFLEAEEYIGVLSHMPGGRLSLTAEDNFATPEDQGVLLAPGQLTSIATRYTEIQRKSSPYSDCISQYPSFGNIDPIARSSFGQYKYNIRVCDNLCIANRLLQMCSCVDQYFFNLINGNPLCDPWNSTTRNCRQEVYLEYERNQLNCGCRQACEDRNFAMTISQSDWPAENYAPYLLSRLRKGGLGDSTALKEWTDRVLGISGGDGSSFNLDNILGQVRNNLARVEVYYEELNYEKLSEVPAYTLVSLVSDFGGNIGLWTGVCAFNIFEVVRLVVDMGILAFNRRMFK